MEELNVDEADVVLVLTHLEDQEGGVPHIRTTTTEIYFNMEENFTLIVWFICFLNSVIFALKHLKCLSVNTNEMRGGVILSQSCCEQDNMMFTTRKKKIWMLCK